MIELLAEDKVFLSGMIAGILLSVTVGALCVLFYLERPSKRRSIFEPDPEMHKPWPLSNVLPEIERLTAASFPLTHPFPPTPDKPVQWREIEIPKLDFQDTDILEPDYFHSKKGPLT